MNLTENSFTSFTGPDTYTIVQTCRLDYVVKKNGVLLIDKKNGFRYFKTRNSARKRIARERSGDFHK